MRARSIEALLEKAHADFANLKVAYESSLHEEQVREDLKIAIKNIFENLRSCLDYLTQDIYDTFCPLAGKPKRLYFPICPGAVEFESTIAKDYPNLKTTSRAVYDILEAIQPYHDIWIGHFNMLNNHNKHRDLVEQTRTETQQVTMTRGQGVVSWGTGVSFGPGVSVLGVPINPRTQMPVPNKVVKTEVVVWVDFRFRMIDQPVLPFVDTSMRNVDRIFRDLQPYLQI